jgi:hypothetical protein
VINCLGKHFGADGYDQMQRWTTPCRVREKKIRTIFGVSRIIQVRVITRVRLDYRQGVAVHGECRPRYRALSFCTCPKTSNRVIVTRGFLNVRMPSTDVYASVDRGNGGPLPVQDYPLGGVGARLRASLV